MLVKLPNGLIDEQDHFNYVEIDELRGKQQNYLVNKELVVGNIGHIPKILEDMILSFQTEKGLAWKGDKSKAIWKLPSGDIETLLVKIRENTYGPKYYHGATCSHCGHEHKDLLLKLDELEIKELPLEKQLEPKVIFLPKEQVEVELKPPYLKDLMDSINIMGSKHDSLVTSFLAVSIKRIGDNTKPTLEDIGNLRASDIDFLQEEAEKLDLEGNIDTDIFIDCQNSSCGKEFEVRLNCFEPSFLARTRG